ncbi:MAG: hypothetical protein LBB28_01470 [Synergistaceae bacterium]|jgi:hypothetical protein|nr:hypothetical protein [Synergistaceae bacterium]
MPSLLDEIGRKLKRVFLGRIVVRGWGELRRKTPCRTWTHFREVSVKPLRIEPRVKSALFVEWKNSRAKSAGSVLGGYAPKDFKVSGFTLGASRELGVKQYKFNIKSRARARHAMARMNGVPSTRRNRILFLKKPPKMERSTLLAVFTPIFQEKVAKSALDKASGNLLFWYDNKRVKMGDKYHLLLLRVFGGEKPLKWVWLPADKKIG